MQASPYARFDDDLGGRSLVFSAPHSLITAESPDAVLPALEQIEAMQQSGKWLAGFVSYEAGFALDPALKPLADQVSRGETPLLCFGVFDEPTASSPLKLQDRDPEIRLRDLEPAWDFDTYRDRFDRLHADLMAGNCYQGNLTFPVNAQWQGDPEMLYRALSVRQPVRYGAFIDLAGPKILSRSPELFFQIDADGFIETHPMKGTARRGSNQQEDEDIIAAMLEDEKTFAENCMIVDLLRNDISRIAEPGSVHVPKLFEIETYPTLHQMVSHVRARRRVGTTLPEIFSALFPCGSITGAPKIAAMKILHALEDSPRGVYCGAIGHIAPSGEMRFNVAIRTLSLFDDGRVTFNVGGGIVLDSTARNEYHEALLKSRFATGNALLGP